MKYYIYTLDYNNIPFYIGKTIDMKTRLRKHKQESNKKRTNKEIYINSIINNGEEIYINILDVVELGNEDYWEMFWIEQFRQWGIKLYNSTSGGEGGDYWTGKKHSIKTKEKISKSRQKQIKDGSVNLNPLPGELNGRSKLKNEDVLEIRRLKDGSNISYSKLSIMFNVSKTVIINIVKRRRWKHI